MQRGRREKRSSLAVELIVAAIVAVVFLALAVMALDGADVEDADRAAKLKQSGIQMDNMVRR